MSGGNKVIAIYAKALADRGHRVSIVAPAHPKVTLKQRIKALVKTRKWLRQPAHHPSHLDGLGLDCRILDRFRPVTDADVADADVVIATWWETAEWVAKLSSAKGAKVYFVQHHEVFHYLPVERARATYKLPMQKIVIARWLQDLMAVEYGDTSAVLVRNAVDHEQFCAPPRGKQKVPTIGFLYAPIHFKGTDVTLQAIDRLRQRIPNLRVIAFGIFQPDLNFDKNIEFHYSPPQQQIRQLYAQCDVWVTASRSEGFNLPAMEAMACRTPVVSTRTGWPEEGIETGRNGVLVDVDDVDALAEGIQWVLRLAEADWSMVSSHAYETVAGYSWENSSLQFEQALHQACLANYQMNGEGQVEGTQDFASILASNH